MASGLGAGAGLGVKGLNLGRKLWKGRKLLKPGKLKEGLGRLLDRGRYARPQIPARVPPRPSTQPPLSRYKNPRKGEFQSLIPGEGTPAYYAARGGQALKRAALPVVGAGIYAGKRLWSPGEDDPDTPIDETITTDPDTTPTTTPGTQAGDGRGMFGLNSNERLAMAAALFSAKKGQVGPAFGQGLEGVVGLRQEASKLAIRQQEADVRQAYYESLSGKEGDINASLANHIHERWMERVGGIPELQELHQASMEKGGEVAAAKLEQLRQIFFDKMALQFNPQYASSGGRSIRGPVPVAGTT